MSSGTGSVWSQAASSALGHLYGRAAIVRLTRLSPSAIAIGVLFIAAVPAGASLSSNGINVNGLTLNGLTTNSLSTNAMTVNALAGNALNTNALTSNSLTNNTILANALISNGLANNAITLNSLTLNAILATGLGLGELNGVAVEGIILPDQPAH
jgi:hypothetical protein